MASNNIEINKKRSSNSKSEDFVCEPLDEMVLPVTNREGAEVITPALSIGFMEPRDYVTYKVLPCLLVTNDQVYQEAEIEEWLERLSYLEEDLSWILRLPYQRFWCQALYDTKLQLCLQSFLSRAPRDYDLNTEAREDLLVHQKKLHKLVFYTFLRMSTYKESTMCHINSKVFGDLIYDSFIFDIPRMMDLCVLYGFSNPQIIAKLIQNLFNTQPNYLGDLEECLEAMLSTFDTIEEKFGLKTAAETLKTVCTLKESDLTIFQSIPLSEVLDLCNYVTDILATLYCFIEAFPRASSIFYKCGASFRLPQFYELVFPLLEREFAVRRKTPNSQMKIDIVTKKLVLSKTFLIKIFRNFVTSNCIDPVLNARCGEENSDDALHLEEFLKLFTELATEKVFLYAYNQLYPIATDLEIFAETGINIDDMRFNYILSSVTSPDVNAVNDILPAPSTKENVDQDLLVPSYSADNVPNMKSLAASLNATEAPVINGYSESGACAATPAAPDELQIVSLIQGILDILPDYGDGYLEKCLDYYNYDPEQVIDALITCNLPPCLMDLPTSTKREPKQKLEYEESVLSERRNVFDHDEFDVFNREDFASDRIHIGKSNKTPSQYNSEGVSEKIKELTLKFEDDLEAEEERLRELNLYEDEYDDTYDSHPISLAERQPENELFKIRPPTVPIALRSKKIDPDNDEEEEDDEEETDDSRQRGGENEGESEVRRSKQLDFCINPEIIRQKREAYHQAKWENKQGRRKMPEGSSEQNNPTQFKSKERHKGQVANHNRRNQADFKRSRGMMSSNR